MSASFHDPQSVLAAIAKTDRFHIQQVFRPIANEYRISLPAPGSTAEAEPILFVKQKKMKIKEDIRFRVSPDDPRHVFMIKSKSVFEFRGRHDVLDEHDQVIGTLEKDFGKSLLRSHWTVRDAAGTEVMSAQEANIVIAIVRRFAGMVSDLLAGLQWLPFNFTLYRGGEQAGTYQRLLGSFRDRYLLEAGPPLGDVDRRLLLAFAVALDALQDR